MSSEDSLSDLMSRKRKEEPLRELDRGNELLSTSKRQRSDDVFRRELLTRKDTVTSVRRTACLCLYSSSKICCVSIFIEVIAQI